MTLSDLKSSARAVRLGASSGLVLADEVLAYIEGIEEAERGATPRQREVLDFYEAFRSEHKAYPTIQQVADALGVSKVTVFEHTNALVDKGLMRKTPHVSRGLELVR